MGREGTKRSVVVLCAGRTDSEASLGRRTPLHILAESKTMNKTCLAKALFKAGADVNAKDNPGYMGEKRV